MLTFLKVSSITTESLVLLRKYRGKKGNILKRYYDSLNIYAILTNIHVNEMQCIKLSKIYNLVAIVNDTR